MITLEVGVKQRTCIQEKQKRVRRKLLKKVNAKLKTDRKLKKGLFVFGIPKV